MYPVFGNPWVGMAKNGWDTFLNHSGVVNVMLANKITDLQFLQGQRDVDNMLPPEHEHAQDVRAVASSGAANAAAGISARVRGDPRSDAGYRPGALRG